MCCDKPKVKSFGCACLAKYKQTLKKNHSTVFYKKIDEYKNSFLGHCKCQQLQRALVIDCFAFMMHVQ